MSFFSRMLDTFESAESFLENVIGYKGTTRRDGIRSVAIQIANIEMNQSSVAHHDTLNATAYRQQPYRNDDKRIELRQRIYSELISKPHLDDDDKINGIMVKYILAGRKTSYLTIQKNLINYYQQDFSKHADIRLVPRWNLVWNSIPM